MNFMFGDLINNTILGTPVEELKEKAEKIRQSIINSVNPESNEKNDSIETKYILELTQEQADIISLATDLYSRIRLGQFDRIIDHTLEERIDEIGVGEFIQRKKDAEKHLLAARTVCFPELETTFQHSYGLGRDKKCQVAWNVHQVLRYRTGNDERKPYAIWGELPKIKKVEEHEGGEFT